MSRSSDTDTDGCFVLVIAFVIALVAYASVLVPIFGDTGAKLVSVIAIGFGLLKWRERNSREREAQEQRQAEWRRKKEQEDRRKEVEQAAREAELRRQKEKEALEEERRLKSFGFGNVESLSGAEFELESLYISVRLVLKRLRLLLQVVILALTS